MKLLGTPASPFTRRVRIVAAELGEPIEWVDSSTEAGQAELRALSPIWKVPVAVVGGRTVFDSRAIVDWLIATRGYGELAPPGDAWRERNLLNAVDESMMSIIQVFYLRRDRIAVEGNPFAQRQLDRTDAIFAWLARELTPRSFGLAELSLICALDWMDFRKTYPTERAAALAPIRAAWAERPSVVATRPHA
ncbi:MAG TPA: glutathione S-transferase family protein [Kofleriaceae bacterium]|jgi:glutathione S-transferase|nr:glutathione S-transferase family protein [Kofleriaceae bacterium]